MPPACVYGCWCERLRPSLGTIDQQNGLVSLYIHANHNCLNDTSSSTVHMKCVAQTHQHPTRSLLCRPSDTRCQSPESAQKLRQTGKHTRIAHVYIHNLYLLYIYVMYCKGRTSSCYCLTFGYKCLFLKRPCWPQWSIVVSILPFWTY